MKRDILICFLIGLTITLFLDFLFSLQIEPQPDPIVFLHVNQTFQNENPKVRMGDVKKIRILCFLNTSPKTHATRAVHIFNTWGKHCDKLLFASSLTDINIGAMGLNVSDDHDHMWGKEKLMLQHIHKNHLNEFDWFLKADDDTFLIAENLRYLLASYSTEDPIYFGYKFNTSLHKLGYFSGGSGYALSRNVVRTFVEKILVDRKFFVNENPEDTPRGDGLCHINTDKRIEDWEISVCLDNFHVYPGDGRDVLKRERFLMYDPEWHLLGRPIKHWYWSRKYYWTDEGLDCCSNYTIAFHYIKPKNLYTLYYLTYRLTPYGINNRFAPVDKMNFKKVADILDREKDNLTLRGY